MTELTTSGDIAAKRSWLQAMLRGFASRCPACASRGIFAKYMKIAEQCPACGLALHHHRADDAPPYFTIMIVGHIIVPLVLIAERVWRPELWMHAALWLPLTLGLTLLIMPRVKASIVGLQWALRMHGFSGEPDPQSSVH
jgi:uncharacterized protein (DUF983 family)